MKEMSYSFLTVGRTADSTEVQEFKRYVGLANCKILAVNPSKKEFDELMGFESANEPEYLVDDEIGKGVKITFIVQTVPSVNNGIKITRPLTFTLHNAPAYTQDKSQVTVIDDYGSCGRMVTEDAKAGNKPVSVNGKDLRVAPKYRMACDGEPALVSFLKAFLGVPGAFDYINGQWVLNEGSQKAEDGKFKLDNIKDYFRGDVSEIKEAVALRPNSEVKVLFGVRSKTDDEGNVKYYQTICTREDMFLRGNAKVDDQVRLDTRLQDLKNRGSFANTDFRVQDLAEWTIEPTDLEQPAETSSSDMPWD